MRDWLILRCTRAEPADFHALLTRACRDAGIKRKAMLGTSRSRHIAWPRQDLMLALYNAGHSYSSIGRLMNRNHATVMTGIAKARARLREPVADEPEPPSPPKPVRHRERPVHRPPLPAVDPFSAAFRAAFPQGASYGAKVAA